MQKSLLPARQIALFCACVLPAYKLVEVPALLAERVQGGLLFPALVHFLLQFAVLSALLYVISQDDKPLVTRLKARMGKWLYLFYALYGVFFIFYVILPLLDLEKFTYAVFYDTAPTTFSFGFFFLVCAFIGAQKLVAVGRFSDIAAFLFPVAFITLAVMSFPACDFSAMLPLVDTPFQDGLYAFKYTAMPFSDVAILLPLLLFLDYRKGDGKKIGIGYAVGALATLIFLTLFYGVFSTTANREHYAFAKIAQYFPPLRVVGRIDLLFVYFICVVLFFYAGLPVLYTVRCVKGIFPNCPTALLSGAISVLLFLFTLFFNKYYDNAYRLFGNTLYPVFWLFSLIIPLGLLFFKGGKKHEKNTSAQ